LVIVILVLGASVGVMLSMMNDQKKEAAEKEIIFESYRTSLERELTDLQGQFGELQTDNDSLLNLASEQQDRITRLLSIQADNAHRIRTYQKELETLRGVLRSYVVQVDSLQQRARILTDQNVELERNLAAERAQRTRLTADLERTTSTVQRAQVLNAGDIVTVGLNRRGQVNQRVGNIEKLRTCFTIRENSVAAAGERFVYLVIIMPDKRVLTNRNNATFTTQDGAAIVFTERRAVEYENRDIEPCIFTDNEGRLMSGVYEALLYCDGYLIGSSTFDLR